MKEIEAFTLLCLILPVGINFEIKQNTDAEIIVFDYSHGQNMQTMAWNETDPQLDGNLTEMGYQVVWALGGINESVLSNAKGLIIGSLYGNYRYHEAEIKAIYDWFSEGMKFLWIGCDNDFEGQYINDNMSCVLERIGSHAYPEPCQIEDAVCCCVPGFKYRVYAPIVNDDEFVSEIVDGVDCILMHGPTTLYGSNSSNPGCGINPIALEEHSLPNLYPLLYFNSSAVIYTDNSLALQAHVLGQQGPFVGATLEINAGLSGKGVLLVSGASPYGDYQPMYTGEYYGVEMNGYRFVLQAIQFGMDYAESYDTSIPLTIIVLGIISVLGVATCVISLKIFSGSE